MVLDNIVIASDSFKESLTAKQACESINNGILEVIPGANVMMIPMADGGEGTVQALVDSTSGKLVAVRVHDPLGREIESFFGLLGDHKTAIIEMAAASGIELLKNSEKDPMITSSFGTGELIHAALDEGCRKIILGIGGSATNDGGAGMIQALGAQLLDEKGNELKPGGTYLKQLQDIKLDDLDPRLKSTSFIVASDVDNPLLGENGATKIFGPQKGADKLKIEILEKDLEHFANITESFLGKKFRDHPGAGAAGGLGFSALAFLNANLNPGFDVVAKLTSLEESIKKADLVITGEGKLDAQTRHGKTPFGVAQLAKKYNIPVIAFAGKTDIKSIELYKDDFIEIIQIVSAKISLQEAMENASDLLCNAATKTIRKYFHR